MILFHPPQVRNCEPPVALAHLAGALQAAGEPVCIVDGALEAFHWLSYQRPGDPSDLQAKRVRRNRDSIVNLQNSIHSRDKYIKAISDIKLLVSTSFPVMESGIRISPVDYQDPQLSPLKSSDLIKSRNNPEQNLFYPWFSERLKGIFENKEHKHIGISIGYLSQALTGLAICGWIKKEYPQIRVQLGGSLINSWLRGPSDMTFLFEMADNISRGKGEEDMVWFAGREFKGSGKPEFFDLYDRTAENDYITPRRILPYSASTGCSWQRCTFCSETWEKNPYCEKSAKTVTGHLTQLSEQYKPALIHLCDSEINPALLQALLYHPPGPDWYGFSRFLREMTDIKYCRDLYKSGCRMLCLGLESGDQEILNKLKKGILLERVSPILRNLRESGILTYIYIMFGTPSENKDAAYRTKDFIFNHSNCINYLNASVFNMPIGSMEAKDVKTMDFYRGDLSLYTDFIHPSDWNRGTIRTFIDKEFREILKRTPPVFTSSHAPFMPVET
ncbi:MAG: radical SAM protein [Spirochaetaceae bacterium]|jgi:hypothetical protein|nr:radical SAM protein [Spirochaetaceae bacterium]